MTTAVEATWRDPSRPVEERVADLLGRMTLEEKLGQLGSIWVGANHDGDGVAPMQDKLTPDAPPSLAEAARHGLGQLTRVFGTRPVTPDAGMRALAGVQAEIIAANRFGIPAVAHEECLTGLNAWGATAFPTPLAWGASFDPEAVYAMAAAIGESMRAIGVHQGLAPVLDVTRDARWGRVEETIGEDPYLVGTLATAYVRGLQDAGIVATLKHFAGYSASRVGRNLAPVAMGPREFADVMLPPFEMALREGGARAVMSSYTDTDGVPAAADRALLTDRLRDELGFTGIVVSDYFGLSFLETFHRVADSPAASGALALAAGVDVELPDVRCYGEPLLDAVRAGHVPEALVDRAAARVLRQKCELGLLDGGGLVDGSGLADSRGLAEGAEPPARRESVDLDPPAHRALARKLAEESVILLANDGGLLPLSALPITNGGRVAVVGPLADDPLAFLGCYSFPRHVVPNFPGFDAGLALTPVLGALRAELPGAEISYARGCDVNSTDRSLIPAAVAAARAADLVVAVLGDEAGLFGRGTSGEGCDVTDLRLPGLQEDLLEALADTGVPVVLVLVTGRPYAVGRLAPRLAGIVQAFFPGEEGGPAIAGVLSGRVVPSGKLPVEMPSSYGAQPTSYLRAPLAGRSEVSSVDPTAEFAFGHGLSYTTFEFSDLTVSRALIPTDGEVEIGCVVRNTGERAGAEVAQLYLSDPVAQVVRPVRMLAGYARVALAPGEARRVVFRLHAERTAFHGRDGVRIVEPGLVEVAVGPSSAALPLTGSFTITGQERPVGADRVLTTPVRVE